MFFVLSLFTLCISYERKHPTYKQFLLARARRIIPGYWTLIFVGVVLSCISLVLLGKTITMISPKEVLINFLLLNGLFPGANNLVVRGGWFIGAIVLFYLLTPFVYRFYFSFQNKEVRRKYFCFVLFALCFLISTQLFYFFPDLLGDKSAFLYYFFVNQLPSYALGIVLFDLYKSGDIHTVKRPWLKTSIFLIGAFILFYLRRQYLYFFFMIPYVFSLAFVYSFVAIYNSTYQVSFPLLCWIKNYLHQMGMINFAVYLVHPFVAFDFKKILQGFFGNGYIWIIPLIFVLTTYLGKLFNRYLQLFQRKS